MRHISVPVDDTIEIIDIKQINPLIAKVQIKVCYVCDTPNRNGTVMSKEFLQNAAVGLRGCPIVGFYDKAKQDFLGHERELTIDNGEFKYIDITRPYGFVDLNAKIWFQKFKDDNSIIREYLCTEGYIWSEAYPEAKRLLMGDNNQSIHLHEPSVNGFWTQNLN